MFAFKEKVSDTSSAESSWVRYPFEENTEGESHGSFDVSGDILTFYLQKRGLLGNQ